VGVLQAGLFFQHVNFPELMPVEMQVRAQRIERRFANLAFKLMEENQLLLNLIIHMRFFFSCALRIVSAASTSSV